ncbi:hypothetical protein [Streptomyces sp. NPDC006971]|uniref:hypothetical protein n=1 Tax=Streptomyces sp. NPDC006971 TaxID=3154784 RepID=UPI00340418E1
MILLLGLIILIAAVVVAVAGIFANGGSANQLTNGFSVFGYHVTGSTGTLFLYGIVVGALAMFGLSLIVAAGRRPSHHSRASRRGLGQPGRGEDAPGQHDTHRAEHAHRSHDDRPVSPRSSGPHRWHFFGHRSAPR